MTYRAFKEAKQFVQNLGLKSRSQWLQYCKSSEKPNDIPTYPQDSIYKSEWKGWGDWLGTGRVANQAIVYRPFEEARKFVHALRIENVEHWSNYCKSGNKPKDIPSKPRIYKKSWKGWGDWLGTGRVANQNIKYKPFQEARKLVRSLKLKNYNEWEKYCRSGKKPADVPAAAERVYKKEWKGIGDWLGTGRVANQNRIYLSFKDAKRFTHSLKLKNQHEWRTFVKSGKKPFNIPAYPEDVYKKEWKGYGEWLGTGRVASQGRTYRSFKDAKRFTHSLNLKSRREWYEYCRSINKPFDIPVEADGIYKKYWKGWGDWLGTGFIAYFERDYRPFKQAKEFVHKLGLKNEEEWEQFSRSDKKPNNIPASPRQTYKKEWIDIFDWLGYEDPNWSIKKVKELLNDLIKSGVIYQWDEAVLYSFLLRKGLLQLSYDRNRHSKFFKNLIAGSRTEEGRKAIENYVNSDSKIPPDLSKLSPVNMLQDQENHEIESATSKELALLVDQEKDPMDYGQAKTTEQILANTNVLESISIDEEAMQFYLDYSIDELWKKAFQDKNKTVAAVKKEGKNGNKYHDAVVETFLSEYEAIQNTRIPNGYGFPYSPTLMQLYVAHKVKTIPFFGNFSGTGAGKTLSAVLASRVIDSKMTVIVCPNDVVNQWARSIVEIFPDSKVIIGKEAFYAKYDEDIHQHLVLNYDKFSQEDSPNLILNLAKERIDFIILDEIHFVKKRDEDASQRRRNLDGLMTAVRKKNERVKVLGLSATPVVNNLMEGRSLLELITGKAYDDVATRPTIPNAVTLYEKLSTISIRELPQYSIDLHTDYIEVEAARPPYISIRHLKSNPLSIEQFLTDARIPEIVNHIENQTIIYTEYVTDVIEKLSKAVANAGYTYALYTGSDRTGLSRFLNKKIQVLIASRPISVGVDGLQHICNRLIINTLPWTNAQYQQLLGRLVRKGQIRDVVNVYVVKASISGYPYDQLKWNRIQFKRTLADCAVDGRLPEKNLVTPQQAAMEAVKWLERLELGQVSSITRRDLNVELTPVQIEKRIRKYGDFTRLNNQINTEISETTHHRMIKDPKEWEEYHRQYREARKTWSIIPYEVIIKRIKELSPRLQVGDFGCGEAKIMESIGENRVNSFDHVSINNKVTACDMKSVPLPDEALDVAVFSLSLMGKNWADYIIEAKRCLATNGYLLIAETTKSMRGRLSNIRDIIKQQGFEIYEDEERADFTFIEAREL